MYKNCVSDISCNRQLEIESTFTELFLVQDFEQINISKLCDQLDVPRKTFYRYFSGRKGVLCAVIDRMLTEFSNRSFSPDKNSSLDDLEHFFVFWKAHKPFLDALARNHLTDFFVSRIHCRSIEDSVARKLEQYHGNVKCEYSVVFLMTGLVSVLLQWHQDGMIESPRKMAGIALHLMTHPLFP